MNTYETLPLLTCTHKYDTEGDLNYDTGIGLMQADNGQYYFTGLIDDDPEEQGRRH